MKERFIKLAALGLAVVNIAEPFAAYAAAERPFDFNGQDELVYDNHEKEAVSDEDDSAQYCTVKLYYSVVVNGELFEVEKPATMSVRKGKAISVPTAPTVTGYAFTGWDKEVPKHIDSDMEFHALYEKTNGNEVKATQGENKKSEKVLTEGVLMSDEDFKAYVNKLNSKVIETSFDPGVSGDNEDIEITTLSIEDVAVSIGSEQIISESKAVLKNTETENTFIPFRQYIIPYLEVHSGDADDSLVPYLWCKVFNEEKTNGKWTESYGIDYTDKNGNAATTKGSAITHNKKYDKILAKAFAVKDSELTTDNVSLFNAMYASCPDVLVQYLKDYKDHPEVTNAIIEYFNSSYTTVYSYENNDIGLYLLNIFAHNYGKLSPRLEKYTKESCLAPLAFAYMQDDKRIVISKEETPEVYDLVARSRFAATFSTYNRYENLLFPNKGKSTELDTDRNRALHQEFYAYVINSGKGFGDFVYQAWTGDGFKYPGTTESNDPDTKVNLLRIRCAYDSEVIDGKSRDSHSAGYAEVSKDFMHKIDSLDQIIDTDNYSFKGNVGNLYEEPGTNGNTNIVLFSWFLDTIAEDGVFYPVNSEVKDNDYHLAKMVDLTSIGVNADTAAKYDKWIKGVEDNYRVKINYHLNGGEQNKQNPDSLRLCLTFDNLGAIARKGYTFDGWYLDKDYTVPVTGTNETGWTWLEDEEFTNPSKIYRSGNKSVDVYAKFNANSYKVTINTNGGTCETNVSAMNADDTIQIKDPVRKGYVFTGWTVAGDGASIKNGIFKQGVENSTLTANWEVAKCKVTYRNASGKDVVETYDYGTKVTTLFPEKYGYRMTKYSVDVAPVDKVTNSSEVFDEHADKTSDGMNIAGVTYTIKGDITFGNYAYTPKEYLLTMNYKKDVNNRTEDLKRQIIVHYDRPYGINNNDITKIKGYTFTGWFTNKIGGKKVTTDTIVPTAADHDIFAQYTANSHTVTFDNKNATENGTTSIVTTYDSVMPTINIPKRTGYTFVGYYTAENGGGIQYYDGNGKCIRQAWDQDSDVTLYAHWTQDFVISVNNGTANYNGNGQTGGASINIANANDYTIRYGTTIDDCNSATIPTRTNAGTSIVYFKVTKAGYTDYTGSFKITINKVANPFNLNSTYVLIGGNDMALVSNVKEASLDSLKASTSNGNVFTTAITSSGIKLTGVNSGTATLTVTVPETANYKATTKTTNVIASRSILRIDSNGGSYNGSSNIIVEGVNEGNAYSKTFNYTGSVQTFTAPNTGFYYIESYGAKGGNDSAAGGNGGYLKGYKHLTAGQKVYISCGKMGSSGVTGGGYSYGGGAPAGSVGSSGQGGGATVITSNLRGDGQLSNYRDYKNDVLMVAGGGGGGSIRTSGSGGSVLYAFAAGSINYPGNVINGAGTGDLAISGSNGTSTTYFATGQKINEVSGVSYPDGGGGGGGWIGGRSGADGGHDSLPQRSSGGGASFVNTSVGCIPLELVAGYNSGNGSAKITYMTSSTKLETPVRPGYTFTGWTIVSGSGNYKYNELGKVTMFNFSPGITNIKANWRKN